VPGKKPNGSSLFEIETLRPRGSIHFPECFSSHILRVHAGSHHEHVLFSKFSIWRANASAHLGPNRCWKNHTAHSFLTAL